MDANAQEVLIVGIGNVLLGDEGLGVHVARFLLSDTSRLPRGVEVIEAGTALFDLMAETSRFPQVIVVDAIRAGGKPGTVYRVELEDGLEEGDRSAPALSLHQNDLFGMLAAAKLLGFLPTRVTLLGAEPERVDFTTELSLTLRRSAMRIVAILLGGAKPGSDVHRAWPSPKAS